MPDLGTHGVPKLMELVALLQALKALLFQGLPSRKRLATPRRAFRSCSRSMTSASSEPLALRLESSSRRPAGRGSWDEAGLRPGLR